LKRKHLKNEQAKIYFCYLWFFTNFHDFSHQGVAASKSWFLIFQHQIQLYGGYFAYAICFIDAIFGKTNIWRTNKQKSIFVTYDFSRIFMIFHTMASELANHDFSFSKPNLTIWGILRLCYLYYWCNFWKKQHLKNEQAKIYFCKLWNFSIFYEFSYDGVGASKSWFFIFQHQIQLYGGYLATVI